MEFINETGRDMMVKVGYENKQAEKIPIWQTVKEGGQVSITDDALIRSAIMRKLSKVVEDNKTLYGAEEIPVQEEEPEPIEEQKALPAPEPIDPPAKPDPKPIQLKKPKLRKR